MSTKTDLAKEIINKISPDYAKKQRFFYKKTEITKIFIETDEESAFFEKPKGIYVTIEADFPGGSFEKFDEEVFATASELKKLLPKKGTVLVAGIGNPFLAADSLGPLSAENLFCGEIGKRKLCSIVPGVFGRTGIEPEIIIKAAAEKISPSAIILIDSLASEDIRSICRTVQLSDCGLSPGSGFGKAKNTLSKETTGVPVIAIGTPAASRFSDSVFVSPNEIDILIKRAAKLVSCAISLAVFPELGIDFIKKLIL